MDWWERENKYKTVSIYLSMDGILRKEALAVLMNLSWLIAEKNE